MADTAYQDLLKDTSESKEDGNYFLVTIPDLNPNTTYPFQFRWTYTDKRLNDNWSAVKLITTPGESQPNTPKFTSSNVDTTKPEKIIITWDGTSDDTGNPAITNYDRVDVYIDGAPFDGSKAAYSFKAPGTTIISAPAGTYQIVLYAVSKTGKLSPVSSAVTKTVAAATTPVTSPETPYTPVVTAGLASVIVEWNGKKSDGTDLAVSGFAGAKVYIGTSSGFTPSNDNWVHTLNFANGANKVSIGVGTIIDKSTSAKLEYGIPYYIKMDTINADGTSNNSPVAATGNPITVDKLPASEISTGVLTADASITAGVNGGQRVVISGSTSPFVIYGTDGTTELLKYTAGGTTGILSIKGTGTFSGDLAIGSGDNIFVAEPDTGMWLGNALYASAPFSVSKNGVIKANSGTVGGWTLGSTYLQGTNIKLDTSGITVGSTSSSYFDISPTSLTHRNSDGTASGKFTLTLGASPQLTIDGTLTVGGNSLATSTDLTTGLGTKIGASDVKNNLGGAGVTTISGGVITTGTINLGTVNLSSNTSATGNTARIQITSTGLKAYDGTTNTVAINSDGTASFTGSIYANEFSSRPDASSDGITIDTSDRANLKFWSGTNIVGGISATTNGLNMITGSSGLRIGDGTNTPLSGASVRNISYTTTSTAPSSGGVPGDVVLVYV